MNNKKIYDRSRYGDPRYITDVGHGTYIIEGKSKFWRVDGTERVDYVGFEGGPFIGVDAALFDDNEDIIVESIILENSGKEDYAKITVTTRVDSDK